jgi:hypothetical protein
VERPDGRDPPVDVEPETGKRRTVKRRTVKRRLPSYLYSTEMSFNIGKTPSAESAYFSADDDGTEEIDYHKSVTNEPYSDEPRDFEWRSHEYHKPQDQFETSYKSGSNQKDASSSSSQPWRQSEQEGKGKGKRGSRFNIFRPSRHDRGDPGMPPETRKSDWKPDQDLSVD